MKSNICNVAENWKHLFLFSFLVLNFNCIKRMPDSLIRQTKIKEALIAIKNDEVEYELKALNGMFQTYHNEAEFEKRCKFCRVFLNKIDIDKDLEFIDDSLRMDAHIISVSLVKLEDNNDSLRYYFVEFTFLNVIDNKNFQLWDFNQRQRNAEIDSFLQYNNK